MFKKLFSISDCGKRHRQICIAGVKIKFRKKVDLQSNYSHLPIQNNKIVFRTFNGAFNCNPKYIAEEILRQNLPYDLVWVVNKNILNFIKDYPPNIKLVMRGTIEDIRETSTAKIIIDNERRISYIKNGISKRVGQIYIQTFHGSLGIKKTGVDRNDSNKKALEVCKMDSSQIDYLISNGAYTTNFFEKMFWGNGKTIECGHPRNDIFFAKNENIKEKVCNYLSIPDDKKILLYAPTLREDGDMNCYSLDLEKTLNAVSQKFGNDWVVVTRLHPIMMDRRDEYISQNPDFIDGTEYPDMVELLVSADMLITDYSSCIYDFMLSYKPGFIYATDIKKYDNGRGLYYPLTSTPFPVATTNEEMVANIENFNYEKYRAKVKDFLDEKGCIDDGHASERVVELIKEIISDVGNTQNNKEEQNMIFGAILAGGTGARMDKHNIPKQFIDLCGKPVIIHTIERMLDVMDFDYLYIAIHPSYRAYLQEILGHFNLGNNPKIIIISGGKERVDSVQNVINAVYEFNQNKEDIIVLHDAVRPFTSAKIFKDCIKAAKEYRATIATIPAVDTMLISNDGKFLDSVPDRKTILHGQAPDGFKLGVLKNAIEQLTLQERSYITGTAQICCVKGYPVKVIEGDVKNMKITVEQDLILAEKIYKQEREGKCVKL